MDALLDRTRGPIKWGLVAHTAFMFSVLTISIVIQLNAQSVCYLNGREFPVAYGGPLGYRSFVSSLGITAVFILMFPLNQWLADGFLVSSVLNSVT
jgi:hypothetical protein